MDGDKKCQDENHWGECWGDKKCQGENHWGECRTIESKKKLAHDWPYQLMFHSLPRHCVLSFQKVV